MSEDFTTGPPMPGTPWFRLPPAQEFRAARSTSSSGSPSPPPGTFPSPGTGKTGPVKPWIERVPDVANRLRRHTEKVATIFNSLLAQGFLVFEDASTYRLRGGAIVEDHVPGPTDDRTSGIAVGMLWVNSTTQAVYVCTKATVNGATWKLIG